MGIEILNPTTGKVEKTFDEMTPDDVTIAIQESHDAHLLWRTTTFADRSKLMNKAAAVLRKNTDTYSKTMALEMGKPLADGKAEIEKCAWVCEYYAENAEAFLADEPVETDASKSYVAYDPIGVVLAVMPWNFPFWQVFRFAAPALMAGNAGVLKHASNVPESALAIEDVFVKAGFPRGLFRTLLIGSKQVAAVIENPHVKAVTLTGSTPAGKAVAAKAGEQLKKTVLELGGSDPYIILADADIAEAAKSCAISRLINAGQSCIAAKRFIVDESIMSSFTNYLVDHMKTTVMGDPLKEKITMGPQARHDLRDELHKQVVDSVVKGAVVVLGGTIPDSPGAFYPATILTGVKPGMPAYDEELFGPVASVITAKDEEDAVRIANDSVFGLGSAIFTQDVKKAEKLARRIQAGATFINTFVKSDPRMPFGGEKQSGYGRELSAFGIREFVNIHSVFIK